MQLDPIRLAARQISALDVADALKLSNVNRRAGSFEQADKEIVVEVGTFFKDAQELENLVIRVADGRPVYLKDVATVIDGPAEIENYSWMGFGPADAKKGPGPFLGDRVKAAVREKRTDAILFGPKYARRIF